MVELGVDRGFAQEPFSHGGIVVELARQQLEMLAPAGFEVLHLIGHRPAVHLQDAEKAITSNFLSNTERHPGFPARLGPFACSSAVERKDLSRF
jgi:hypothetical protein